jgi:hypothetical protein
VLSYAIKHEHSPCQCDECNKTIEQNTLLVKVYSDTWYDDYYHPECFLKSLTEFHDQVRDEIEEMRREHARSN